MVNEQSSAVTPPDVWQDSEIRFDLSSPLIQLRKGEVLIDSINSVEDTKGNNGERGLLEVTNLRLLWASHRNIRTNLSIGFKSIISVKIKVAHSKLRGDIQGLYIITKFNDSRFEFVFTSLVKESPRLFTTIQAVHRSYETTTLYRDLKLRGAIIQDGELNLLPNEQVYRTQSGVWNLSSDQGNLGTFCITNVRVVWFANLAHNFNVSMPYMRINAVRIRESKFGMALVIDTSPGAGEYVLGFRISPEDQLQEIYDEIVSLHRVFSVTPIFGVEYEEVSKQPTNLDQLRQRKRLDDVEIIEDESTGADTFTAYYAAANKNRDRDVVFSPQLGLAIEALPDGFCLDDLWNVQ